MLKRTTFGIIVTLLPAMSLPVLGQYYVPQGNALDANNRVGSGGVNYSRPAYQINSGNRLISGNVTSGAAFRGYSPIRDSNSFFLGSVPGTTGSIPTAGFLPGFGGGVGSLPSDRLTNFRRDSIGINEVRQFSGIPSVARMPYYSQSTVADTGLIRRGLNQPGTSEMKSSYTPIPGNAYVPLANPLDATRTNLSGAPLDSGFIRSDTGTSLVGPVNPRLLSSPLFGGIRAVPPANLPGQTDETASLPGAVPRANRQERSPAQTIAGERAAQGVVGAERTDQLSRPIGGGDTTGNEQATGSLARPLGLQGESARSGPQRQAPVVVADQPFSTFVGTADERMKAYLAGAEGFLREERYYDAARQYEMAHAIDLDNPLPQFGKAMSLLAAGDYLSSANDLFLAIRAAGTAGAIRIDLQQFIPDLKILDQRRAFLEQQLGVYEDFRLRFLLGWAEYMSGMSEMGLKDMRQAVEAAPPTMDALGAFVEMLSVRPATQPAGGKSEK